MIHEISPMDPKSPQILSMKTSNCYFGAALHFSPYNYLVCENTIIYIRKNSQLVDEFYALALKKKKKTQLFSVICEGQHSMAMVEKKILILRT